MVQKKLIRLTHAGMNVVYEFYMTQNLLSFICWFGWSYTAISWTIFCAFSLWNLSHNAFLCYVGLERLLEIFRSIWKSFSLKGNAVLKNSEISQWWVTRIGWKKCRTKNASVWLAVLFPFKKKTNKISCS